MTMAMACEICGSAGVVQDAEFDEASARTAGLIQVRSNHPNHRDKTIYFCARCTRSLVRAWTRVVKDRSPSRIVSWHLYQNKDVKP